MGWVRRGHSYREAARRWRVSVHTVARWVQRAKGCELARMDWADRPRGNRQPAWRTPAVVVRTIVRARRRLQAHDALGEHGPEAIRRWLQQTGQRAPSARTIARILASRGLSGQERWRRPPPPKGWYLPDVACGRAELDQIDIVEGLQLRGATAVEVLNALSLWGRLAASWPQPRVRTDAVLRGLREHWQRWGRPAYLQCDNDTVFSGAHAQRAYLGRLVHWCLCVGVTPVFTPPYEFGFQAGIEAYNRRWQERVWRRWRHRNHTALRKRSTAFVQAYIARQDRSQPAPGRRPWQGRGPRGSGGKQGAATAPTRRPQRGRPVCSVPPGRRPLGPSTCALRGVGRSATRQRLRSLTAQSNPATAARYS